MKQSQLYKIQVHNGRDPMFAIGENGGWFLKIEGDDGTPVFHLVDDSRNTEMTIPSSMVDESLCNREPSKPYYVVFAAPPKLQPLVTNVSSKLDTLATQSCLEAKLGDLSRNSQVLSEHLKMLEQKAAAVREKLEGVDKQIVELYKISVMPSPHFVYAYGKHPGDDREFCWRVPYSLYNLVQAGSKILVDTRNGEASVVVTKIEQSHYLLDHKLVLSVG